MHELEKSIRRLHPDQRRFLQRLARQNGNLEKAALRGKVSLFIINAWLEGDPEYRYAHDYLIELIQERLMLKIIKGNVWATIAYLAAFCKHRGYF